MPQATKVDIIIEGLKIRIQSGEFDDGRLPSFRKLVQEYTTSQETMNKAMQTLQAEGLLVSSGAKGVFVNKSRIRIPGINPNFFKYITDFGENHGFEVIEETISHPEIFTAPGEITKKMGLPRNSKVLRRFRKQGSNQSIFRFAETFYPASLITKKMYEDIKNDPHYPITKNIEKYFKQAIKAVHEDLIVRLPTKFEQEHLQIVRTNPVVDMAVTCYNKEKTQIIMYSHITFNANDFIFMYDYDVAHWA